MARAWDWKKPFIVAPAMNTLMWEHPFTNKHLHVLQHELGVQVIPPITKTLVCGDTGTTLCGFCTLPVHSNSFESFFRFLCNSLFGRGSGAMADVQTIVNTVKQITTFNIQQSPQ